MQVLVLNSVPAGLRGDVTRWFMEIATGVYVGNVSARIRDELWERVLSLAARGRAIMVYPARNEQGYVVRTYQYDWEPEEFDGLTLMLRRYERVCDGEEIAGADGVIAEHSTFSGETNRRGDDKTGQGDDKTWRAPGTGGRDDSVPSVPTDVPPRGWSTAARRRAMKRRR